MISGEKLLKFCNKVREAGGVKPLDALMPGVTGDGQNCVIAKNLNFQCLVHPEVDESDSKKRVLHKDFNRWFMYVGDPLVRDKISEATGMEKFAVPCSLTLPTNAIALRLPYELAEVAATFDDLGETKSITSENIWLAELQKDY